MIHDTGSEDAAVVHAKTKLRHKEHTKWFNQWYNILNWRTMSKVIKEGTLPLQSPNTKAFRTSDSRIALRSAGGSTLLPAITPRSPRGEHGGGSRLGTAQSFQYSAAASTPDSAAVMQGQLHTTVRMQEETVRSFIAEVKALEHECTHWKTVVDSMRVDLRRTQTQVEEAKLAHLVSTDKAAHELLLLQQQAVEQMRDKDVGVQAVLQEMLHELAESLGVLQAEDKSMQQLQIKTIVANAPSRGESLSLHTTYRVRRTLENAATLNCMHL